MQRRLVVVFVSFLLCIVNVCGRYSSKTAYLDSFDDDQINYFENVDNYKIENCTPRQIYLFLRHGARYPSIKQFEKSREFLANYTQYLSTEIENITRILDDISLTFDRVPYFSLTSLGANEMRSIAGRFKSRYSRLFDVENIKSVDLLSSDKNRSVDSAINFIRGLYGDESGLSDELVNSIRYNNTIMRLFDECDRYMYEIKTNKTAGVELKNYENGPQMTKLIENFRKRHQIHKLDLSTSVLRKLFVLCNIEYAHRMKENWCRLFSSPEDYEVLGYYNDLKSYWLKAYGYELNSKVALLMVKDMIHYAEEMIRSDQFNDSSIPRVVLRFGHAENMIPLISTLGLFNDSHPLTWQNYQHHLNRKFRTGKFSPFSANVAFVLHKCAKDSTYDSSDPYDQYKMHILVNELPTNKHRSGDFSCSKLNPHNRRLKDDGSLCDYKHFKAQLRGVLNEDHRDFCAILKQNVLPNGEL